MPITARPSDDGKALTWTASGTVTETEHGQLHLPGLGDECSGHCGV